MNLDYNAVKNMPASDGGGYWKVNGNNYFIRKNEALRYASQVKSYDITYHFFDDIYDKLDWNTEPSESLTQLYLERALQIREKYDWVCLSFSGGSDSTNILNTFLNNNIKLDEIITYYPIKAIDKLVDGFDPKDKNPNNLIFEYTHAVLPVLKKLAVTHPQIKITTLDFTERVIDIVDGDNLHSISQGGVAITINFAGPLSVVEHLRRYDDKACCIWGVDKPKILYRKMTQKFECYFLDVVSMVAKFNDKSLDSFKGNIEYFYHSPDLPKLFQKQCFVVKNEMIRLMIQNPSFYETLLMNVPNKKLVDVYYTEHPFFENLIYPNLDNSLYQAEKQSSLFYMETGSWFFNTDLTSNRTKDYFSKQVATFIHGIDNRFIEFDYNNRPKSFKLMTTRFIQF
jgi:hypothetical protein